MNNKVKTYRSCILVAAVAAMLFAGIIYAWSILKVPFAADFGWTAQQLSLNFTLTMCFFCLGGLLGSALSRKIGVRRTALLSALLAGSGMIWTGLLNGDGVVWLYLSYAVLAGLGIGIAYNVVVSTVTAWFPDKKGFCTGCLMMGFGASSLILGNLADALFQSALSRRGTYIVLGVSLLAVLGAVALFLRRPTESDALPTPEKKATAAAEAFEAREYTTKEMLRRFSFWRAFVMLIFAAAVGNTVISFARDLALSVGAKTALATTLVGVLAVCNGLGRILIGGLFDALGRRKAMLISGALTIAAAGVTLVAVMSGSVTVCVIGLCLTGMSYGSCSTVSASFAAAFYGQTHFASNFSLLNCHLILASFVATACSKLLGAFGNYTVPFVLLLTLAVTAFVLNVSIKKP